MNLPVTDVMTTNLVFVKPSDSVLSAVKKMIDAGLGNVLVMSGGKLSGIVTEKDLITKVLSKSLDPAEVKVSKVMTKKLVTGSSSMSIQDAARKMTKAGIRRLPIKAKGVVIGVVTSNDLLRVEPELVDILVDQLKYGAPRFDGVRVGVCEVCNSYSKHLIRVNDRLVCPNCKKEI